MELPIIEPSRVTVMIKPVGALCNLDCTYCYYLPTKTIYDNHEHRMKLETLESVFASILPRFESDVMIAWQGGEPTLAGLGFFEKMIEFQERHRAPGQRIKHSLQTNGTLLDDAWCAFLHEHGFLVGLSMDGPPRFHDHYRVTNRGGGSFDAVERGRRLLERYSVEFNILCVLNDNNVHHPDELFGYIIKNASRWVQFIPAIEWERDPAQPDRNILAPYSPRPADYGRFLCRVFDLWFERYRTSVSVRLFDAVLNKLVLDVMPFCILDGSCHNQLTIEHDGAVFGCDHFVERRWQLARIGEPGWVNAINLDGSEDVGLTVHGTGYRKAAELGQRDIDSHEDLAAKYAPNGTAASTPHADRAGPDDGWFDRVDESRLGGFAARKQDLPAKCVSCQWKPYCHGGCPKHRPHGGDVPEPTILCEAYMMFYEHAMPRLEWLAGYLRRGVQPPATGGPGMSSAPLDVSRVEQPAATPTPRAAAATVPRTRRRVKPNYPCPCGSGLKHKDCCARAEA